MSTETLTQAIGAGATVQFGAGTQFLIVTAAASVTVKAIKLGSSNKNRVFSNVPAGFKFTADSPDDGFDYLQVTSASAQNVTLAVGTDDVTYSNNVTVSGSVSTVETPAGTLTDAAPVVCNTGAATAVVAQNLNRKRVTLSVDPAFAAGTVYARKTGGTNNLLPLSPGMSYEFAGTYGIDVRNDTGTNATVYVMEEAA